MWRRTAAILASIVVSSFFMWLTLRGVPLADVGAALRQATPLWVVVGVLSGCVGIFTRAIRWRGLVGERLPLTRAFYIMGVMQLMNLLPLRLGEVARTALAAREDVPVGTTASSIVVERLLDLALVLGILAFVIPRVDTLPASVVGSVRLFSGLAVVGFAVLILLARFPEAARRTLAAITSRIAFLERLPLDSLLDAALEGLQPLVNPRRFAHAVVWTVISWFFSYIVFYVSGLALGLSTADILFSLLSLALVAFAVALPVTMAALGPFQGAVLAAGVAFGVSSVTATAVGFLVHGVTIITYIICGVWGFIGTGTSLAAVAESEAA